MRPENMPSIEKAVAAQRAFFATGVTRDVTWRIGALESLRRAILAHEAELNAALKADLNKGPFESYMTEVGMVLSELGYIQRRLRSWARAKRVATPLAQFSARSFRSPEPYGVVLVMSPWNYPFQLALEPVVGAIAAGNCVIIKPSAYAPSTSQAVADLVAGCFEPEFVTVVQGGREENAALLDQEFDFIFFTGGVTVGKLVMEKASRNLTPVCLELGGKSPCIVDATADLPLAARRIVFGKYLNAGQTCVAPDYLLVQEEVRERLTALICEEIARAFGQRPLEAPDYGKIINRKHFDRLLGLMEGENILAGGQASPASLQIAPTLLGDVSPDSPIMGEEIFGPILPVFSFRQLPEAADFVAARPKPLALYLFTNSREAERLILERCSFGGGCINDTIIHLATSHMPFGGVGASGMGGYHGKASFDTFSHYRSIVRKHNWIDLPIRYRPYTPEKARWLRRFLK